MSLLPHAGLLRTSKLLTWQRPSIDVAI